MKSFFLALILFAPIVLTACGKSDPKTTKVGGVEWMTVSVNEVVDSSWCLDSNEENCEKLGRLYSHDAALKICPAGWRLPTDEEWGALSAAATIDDSLRAKFPAPPTGYRLNNGTFSGASGYAYFWTMTEYVAYDAPTGILRFSRTYHPDEDYHGYGFSVRCVR
jgi:hypothetical protein